MRVADGSSSRGEWSRRWSGPLACISKSVTPFKLLNRPEVKLGALPRGTEAGGVKGTVERPRGCAEGAGGTVTGGARGAAAPEVPGGAVAPEVPGAAPEVPGGTCDLARVRRARGTHQGTCQPRHGESGQRSDRRFKSLNGVTAFDMHAC